MKNNGVTIVCYREKEHWDSIAKARRYYSRGMDECDPGSSEWERYARIVDYLSMTPVPDVIWDNEYDEERYSLDELDERPQPTNEDIKMNENTKITMTVGQLKKLVKESYSVMPGQKAVSGNVGANSLDDAFIEELRDLTDANEHASAYRKVAEKCAELGRGDASEIYSEYAKVFGTIAEHENNGVGDFYLRYAVEKAMFERMEVDFGKKFVDRMNKGL